MQSFQLFKFSIEHHLAHLYEHIFYIHLDTLLRDEKFFTPLDYMVDAHTDNGVITLNIELYNERLDADVIRTKINQLAIDFDSEITSIAMRQIEAEYGRELIFTSRDQVIYELQNMHQQIWQDDEITNKKDDISGLINLGSPLVTAELVTTFSYDKVEQSLKPLYRQVAGLVLNNFLTDLADTYGGFVVSEAYQTNTDLDLEGVIKFVSNIKINDLDEFMQSTIDELVSSGGFDHLLDILQNIDKVPLPPSNEKTFVDTGIQMNSTKWKALATQENLSIVLRSLKYTPTLIK